MWNILKSGHLYLILMIVVRVVRKGFGCSPDAFHPEYDTLCSEALDKDALIRCSGLITLSMRSNKIQYRASKRKEKQTESK